MLPTLTVLAWWAVLAPAFIGIGALWSSREFKDGPSLALRFWLGIATTLAFLQLWHFFHAVDGHATAIVCAIGGSAIVARRHAFRRWPFSPVGTLLWGIGIVWLANRSTGPCQQFDSLIYHLHATEWIRAYPVVPGLGNLNDRLAFNNSSFLLAAVVEPGPLRGYSSHFLNGLFLAGLWGQIASSIDKVITGRPLAASDAFVFVLLYPLTNDAVQHRISSLSTDLPMYLFLWAAVWCLLKDSEETGTTRWSTAAVAFSACAVSMKLTAIPLAALLCAIVAFRWLRRFRPLPVRRLALAALVAVAWLGPWGARGIMLTGYPLYPLTILRANVEWAVPVEMAIVSQNNAEVYAKSSDFRTEFGYKPLSPDWRKDWFRRQFRNAKADLVVPAVLIAVALGAVAIQRSLHRPQAELLIAIGLAIVVWFVKSPHVRYGGGVVWSAAALLAGIALAHAPTLLRRLAVVAWPGFAVGTLLLPLVLRGGVISQPDEPAAGLVIGRPISGLFHLPTRTAVMQTFRTTSGLEVQVPIQGEGGWRTVFLNDRMAIGEPLLNAACWPGPLVRTPYPNPALKLRNPNSIADGFVLDPRPGDIASLGALR